MPVTRKPGVPFLRFRLTVEPLTAVHIGSDETIAPYEYDVELFPDDEYGVLTVYNLPRLLSGLESQQRTQFLQLTDKDDMRALRRWLREAAKTAGDSARRFRAVMDFEAARQLHDSLDDVHREGTINLHFRDALNNRPVIPGSSIKGAIRTAVLDRKLRLVGEDNPDVRRATQERNPEKALQGVLLGNGRNLRRDPFRQLAITDVPFEPGSTCIERMQAVRRDGQPAKEENIRVFREVLMSPSFVGQSPKGIGEVRLNPEIADSEINHSIWNSRDHRQEDTHVTLPLPLVDLIDACNSFYARQCLDEAEGFVRQPPQKVSFSSTANVKTAMNLIDNLASNQCVLRVGHHSHFDCVTLQGRLRQNPRNFRGNTRWFAAGLIPLGWVRLTFDPID